MSYLPRDNLDPERTKDDADLWSVLETVHLKETFKSAGLDSDLWKSGSCRLSVGQQQLLSLARAALRSSKLLILDEPSSALDGESEQTLYHCLDTLFQDRTVLLVAVSEQFLQTPQNRVNLYSHVLKIASNVNSSPLRFGLRNKERSVANARAARSDTQQPAY